MEVRQLYKQTLAERGFRSDPAQLHAIDSLERCETEWADYKARRSNALTKLIARPPIPRGVYLWGGVGQGKSFLMGDALRQTPQSTPIPSTPLWTTHTIPHYRTCAALSSLRIRRAILPVRLQRR